MKCAKNALRSLRKSQNGMKATQRNIAALQLQMANMMRIESPRLDRADRLYEELKEQGQRSDEAMQRHNNGKRPVDTVLTIA